MSKFIKTKIRNICFVTQLLEATIFWKYTHYNFKNFRNFVGLLTAEIGKIYQTLLCVCLTVTCLRMFYYICTFLIRINVDNEFFLQKFEIKRFIFLILFYFTTFGSYEATIF